ncbi:retrovirus-related pol polyprotein from transposon TNT 1-94 [Tanacetum coccineum]|uniref:Retrovirus-related pol polyprotein from transposon TNT 1-94 n=1 Tax=Tanacetum coccineum TaxID=301880 RepID=A0ABQ4WN03_9ASTR
MKIKESLNVTFDETPPPSKTSPLVDDDLDEEEAVKELVPHPKSTTIMGTKWVYRNKLDRKGVVSHNKARLVAQGYNQQEGINYDETYALVARLESIRILLAYACTLDFKLFQMDVKSAFLNGFINKEIKQRIQAARDRQKSYVDLKRKPMEFQVGDRVMLKVSPWKGVVRFGKWGKLNPRYVGPFKVLENVGAVVYKLELPQELSSRLT